MKKLCAILMSSLMLAGVSCIYAADEAVVADSNIQSEKDTINQYTPMATKINEAIKAKDMKALAKFMQFPIEFQIRDQIIKFNRLAELEAFDFSYDDVFSADTHSSLIESINKNPCCNLVGYRGANIASGKIWFTDDGIYSINNDNDVAPIKIDHFCAENLYNYERQYFGDLGFSPMKAFSEEDQLVFSNGQGATIQTNPEGKLVIALDGKELDFKRIRYTSDRYPEFKTKDQAITIVGEGDPDESTGSNGIRNIEKIVIFVKNTNDKSCTRYHLKPSTPVAASNN